jgi:DNA polymerase-3 subunit epsilon
MVAFDLETTGVDVETDRIVTAAVIGVGGDRPQNTREWLADPGIEIPEGASEIHKITTEHARANGKPAAEVVDQVAQALADDVRQGAVIVGHNVPYDLTLLDRECRRHSLAPLVDRLGEQAAYVIDTRVLDTHCAPYRKRVSETQGARQLITLAQVYELPWNESEAHGCSYDALMAARVAYRIGTLAHMPKADWPQSIRFTRRPRFHELEGLTLAELHELQVKLAVEQAAGLQEFFRKTDPAAVVDGSWPMRPLEADRV